MRLHALWSLALRLLSSHPPPPHTQREEASPALAGPFLFFVRAAVLVNFHWSGQFSPERVYDGRVFVLIQCSKL
jgi:hypothetical protein